MAMIAPATIVVRDRVVSLDCAKGSAQLSVPGCGESPLGNWREVRNAVSDLALLARPGRASVVLIIPSGDPSESELVAADELRQSTGVTGIAWSVAEGGPVTSVTTARRTN